MMKTFLRTSAIKVCAPFYRFFHHRPGLFRHILIQTNNICTRKCPWCLYGISHSIEKTVLPEEAFKKIIAQLEAINFSGRLSLFEINEPLTDERIFDFVSYVSARLPGVWQFMITNGDLATEEKIKKLFVCGLDELYISSYDEAAYQRTEKVLSHLSLAYRNKIRHFNHCAKALLTDNRGGNLANLFKSENKKLFCDRVNKILFIKPSGEVVSCFADFFNVNIIGNVKEQSLKEIWWSEKFEDLRKNLNQCNRSINSLCKRCNYGGFGGHYKIPLLKHLKKKLAAKKPM